MKKVLPYVLVVLLPGGTVIALGMWLYQHMGRLPKWPSRASSGSGATSPTST
jgi:hypothetical protein